jgi:putative lipoic acid-binding regulatory protein
VQIKDIRDCVRIDYPCRWIYKIIGRNEEDMRDAVRVLIQDAPYEIRSSRVSAKGRYVSLNVEVEVGCEEKRKAVYEALKSHPAIILIL